MHTFFYQLKLLFRNRFMMFWTFIFPLILATFFNLAFSQLISSEGFEPAKLAVVVEKENKEFQSLLNDLSENNNDQLLDTQYVSLNQAQDLLKSQKIDGYIVLDDDIKITFLENGIAQTIIQNIADTYQQSVHTLETIGKHDSLSLMQLLQQKQDFNQNYFESQNMTSLDLTVVYFYTLIGMTCMYGGFWGLKVSTHFEANLSRQGTRIHIAPTSHLKLIFTGTLAAFLCQYLAMLVLLGYLVFGLNIQFGEQTGYIMILMAIGSYVGITLGHLIGNVLKCSENIKINVLTAVSMFCSFLAGMMVIDLKYLVQEYAPIIAYMNPVNLITDALYALYYYPTYERFFLNMFILLGIGLLFTLISVLISRRKQYDSL